MEIWVYDKIMDVNVRGLFELCKWVLLYLKVGGGFIINISSVGGLSLEYQLGIYSVSKVVLIFLMKVMVKEWGLQGVWVNVICFGLIKIKFSEVLWSNEKILKYVLV